MRLDPDAMPPEELARLRADGYGHLIGRSAAEREADQIELLRRQMSRYEKTGRADDAEQWMRTVTEILAGGIQC